jgi:phage shock protein PspC (stress-responsive transcriptional regulator)
MNTTRKPTSSIFRKLKDRLSRAGRRADALCRPREGALVSGLCRGVANHYHLPVLPLRLLFLASLLLGGAGVVAYVLLSFAIPREAILKPNRRMLPIKLSPRALPAAPEDEPRGWDGKTKYVL